MTKVWGAAGHWALDSEDAEAQLDIADKKEPNPASALGAEAFPSLGEAASKPHSKKKKQQQTVSLGEFNSGLYAGPGSRSSRGSGSASEMKGLTPEEMLMLPSRPRERADDEDPRAGGLGGGFKDYGNRGGGGRDRDGGERGSGGRDFGRGFDRDRERNVDEPSRADETDDWGATKKFVPSGDDRQRRGGWTSAASAGSGGASRADEVERWGFNKEAQQPPPLRYEKTRSSGFSSSDTRADDVDHWASKKAFTPAPPVPSSDRQRRNGSGFEFFRREDAPPPSYDSDRWTRRAPPNSESTLAGPPASSERPRINLQPRSLPLNPPSGDDSSKVDNSKAETEEPAEAAAATMAKPRPKISPFGEAKPRDIVLPLEDKAEKKDMSWNSWKKGKTETDSKPPPPTGRSGTEATPKEVSVALGELSVSDDTASSQGENGGADIQQDGSAGKVGEVAEAKKTPERRSYKDVGGGNAWGKPNVIVDREREGNRW